MKKALVMFGVLSLALMGIYGMYTSYGQTAAAPPGIFLLAADEEEEEFKVDIKDEELTPGPDRNWCCQYG